MWRGEERGRPLSSLEKDLPQTLAYPFADQVEAWKETARVRSGVKANNNANNHAVRLRYPDASYSLLVQRATKVVAQVAIESVHRFDHYFSLRKGLISATRWLSAASS